MPDEAAAEGIRPWRRLLRSSRWPGHSARRAKRWRRSAPGDGAAATGSRYTPFMSDRKYKQSGYQDSGSSSRDSSRPQGDRPSGTPRAPRDARDAPRGRGLGAPTASAFRCASCGELQSLAAAAAAAARCTACGSDLHSCTNCAHFDPGAPAQCRQPHVALVPKKSKANDCPQFEPRERQEFAAEKPAPSPKDPRAAFDALFK